MPLAAIGGAIGGAIIGSHGANKAADTQAAAATQAAQIQAKSAADALAFQKQQYSDQQKNAAPWLKAGSSAINSLSSLTQNGGFPDWNKQFQAPTAATEQNDPGFQFRLQQGQQALERSAASRGNLLTGGTAKAEQQYGQDYASNEYGNVYNRALGQYQQGYNEFQTNQANRYNRLAGIAGSGQVSANQLAQSGQAASNNVGNILLTSGQQQGNALQTAGNAAAAGQAATASAYGGLVSGVGNNIQDLWLLNQLGQQQQKNVAGGYG